MRVLGAIAAVGVTVLGAVATTSATRAPAATPAPTPQIAIISPVNDASYERGARIIAHFRCRGAGIISCRGTVASGRAISTRSAGTQSFTVVATDAGGATIAKTVRYTVWVYVNPLRAVAGLQPSRIDMGVDYSGSGAIQALGRAKVVLATDRLAGPESCWGTTCVPPPGDIIVYRLLDGPYAGKYVYVVEHITITVKAGQTVRAGERIAILHQGSPNLEIGWASGHRAETLAAARGHKCSCTDPGGWSSIEGRNFNALLVWLGAPSGYVTTAPDQHMPLGWPPLPPRPIAARQGAVRR